MKLSVCLIVKDEQQTIARCLASVKGFADEVIVADTGSSDRTKEEAAKFTDKIYDFKWCDDFSAARNFSLSKASSEYVMWLDADDVVPKQSAEEIRKLVEGPPFDVAFLPYAAAFDGQEPSLLYERERIFRRSLNLKFRGAVHEAVTPVGKVVRLPAVIEHRKLKKGDPFRNLNIYQKQIARGISLGEREKFYYGRELYALKMYREASVIFRDFLKGSGWVENKIEACCDLYACLRALGDDESALAALFNSFSYAPPRAKCCCLLGEYFFDKDVRSAIYWYECALSRPDDISTGGFVSPDYGGFIPCMQLCVLYDRLGDRSTARAYNDRAGKFKPQNPNYLYNKNYFSKLTDEV